MATKKSTADTGKADASETAKVDEPPIRKYRVLIWPKSQPATKPNVTEFEAKTAGEAVDKASERYVKNGGDPKHDHSVSRIK